MDQTNYDPVLAVVDKLEAKGCRPKKTGDHWNACCPGHGDQRPSLSIRYGRDGCAVIRCHAGCETKKVVEEGLGMKMRDLFAKKARDAGRSKGKTWERLIAYVEKEEGAKLVKSWPYHDRDGKVVFAVLRLDRSDGSKTYRPVHPVEGGYKLGDPPGKLPLYNLPKLAEAETVLVVEGEKCADALNALGFVATTSAHGANQADRTDWAPLAGKQIVILPDNDEPGQGYAGDVARLVTANDPNGEELRT